jgi:HAD superfamily hydrolase (TIGR01490 family)
MIGNPITRTKSPSFRAFLRNSALSKRLLYSRFIHSHIAFPLVARLRYIGALGRELKHTIGDLVAAAAFYDLEGTLVSTNLVHTLGFYARNQPDLVRSFTKSAATLLSVPLFAVSDQYSRKVFNDLFFKRYKGETEDRMRFFADELFEKVLKPAVFPGTFELIEKSRSNGLRQVVVTGALDVSVKPLMEYLGITDYVANRLEFVKGVATGRLLPPVLASATKASWIRTFAEREGINLSESFAYSDSMSDLPMLSIVGHPAVVNPDFRLRQTALHHDWPILNLK